MFCIQSHQNLIENYKYMLIKLPSMKYISKILIILLIFVLILPSVQSTNIFEDIKNIDKGIIEINSRLVSIKSGIDDLGTSMGEMNKTMENVQQSMVLLEETNKEIKDMSEKLDEISNKATEALDLADKVDGYVGDIKTILWVGISSMILVILTLIGATIVIIKRRK